MLTEPNTENNTPLSQCNDKRSVSNHIEEIMTTPPSWIMKWGALIILGTISSIIITSAIIPAPQSVKVSTTIKEATGNAVLDARRKGILKVLLPDGNIAQKDQLIGYIESNVNPVQVLNLLKTLNNFKNSNKEKKIEFNRFTNLGELEIGYYQLQLYYLIAQEAKIKFTNNKSMLPKTNSGTDKKLSKEDIVFARELSAYITELQKWIEENIFVSPVKGKLNYLGLIANGTEIEVGQKVFLVKPFRSQLFGEAKIDQRDIEHVNKGTKAVIRLFTNASDKKMDIIGHVDYISSIPIDTVYMIKIVFETKHIPSSIAFAQGMKFNTEIITGKGSLLTNFIDKNTKRFIPR